MGKKRRSTDSKAEPTDDWIANLARQSTTADAPSRTKKERIEHRNAKKRRRQERKSEVRPVAPVKKDNSNSKSDERGGKEMKQRAISLSKTIAACTRSTNKRAPIYVFEKRAAAKHKKLNWTEQGIQPRNRDYGGIGLARESLFLSLDDAAFFPKLEQEFEEHIPGFFGRARTKAMKKQLDKNMLWRQLAAKKNQKINGKKLSDLSPDQRVEEMIAAGLV